MSQARMQKNSKHALLWSEDTPEVGHNDDDDDDDDEAEEDEDEQDVEVGIDDGHACALLSTWNAPDPLLLSLCKLQLGLMMLL